MLPGETQPLTEHRGDAFRPGFRLSALDVAVLVLGAGVAAAVAWQHRGVGVSVAFVVLHFFLFCNVFRIRRPAELAWALVFAVLCVIASLDALVAWPVVFVVSLISTVLFLIVELRAPSYHGVAWRRINPGLPDWWDQQRRKS